MHFGEIVNTVDMRGEVALLSRSILIQGEMSSSCYQTNSTFLCGLFNYDTFGGLKTSSFLILKGHLTIVKGFKNVHIEGVEFYHMGQQMPNNYPSIFYITQLITY